MVSTRRRWRLFRPWIVNPCSRVLRKLSGELTIIQYWEARPSERPDLRFRRERPDLAGRSAGLSGAGLSTGGAVASGVSDTNQLSSYSNIGRAGRGGPRSWGSGRRAIRLRTWAMWEISWRATKRHTSRKLISP